MQRDINVNVSGPMQPTSTYKTVVLKGNQPFALQVTEPNMKYVIKHNFDLGGESVTIPEGCLIEFDGGFLSNGTINWNDGTLTGDVSLRNIKSGEGKLANKVVCVDWFGTYGDGEHDDSDALVQASLAIKKIGSSLVFGSGKTYLHGDGLIGENGTGNSYTPNPADSKRPLQNAEHPANIGRDIRLIFAQFENFSVIGNGSTIVSNPNNGECRNNSVFWFWKCNNIYFENLTVNGNKENRNPVFNDYDTGDCDTYNSTEENIRNSSTEGYAQRSNINLKYSHNVHFINISSNQAMMDGFFLGGDIHDDVSNTILENCVALYNYRQGLTLSTANRCRVVGGEYSYTGYNSNMIDLGIMPMAGIDVEADAYKGGWITIEKAKIVNNRMSGIVFSKDSSNIKVDGCYFEGPSVNPVKGSLGSQSNNEVCHCLFYNTSPGLSQEGLYVHHNVIKVDKDTPNRGPYWMDERAVGTYYCPVRFSHNILYVDLTGVDNTKQSIGNLRLSGNICVENNIFYNCCPNTNSAYMCTVDTLKFKNNRFYIDNATYPDLNFGISYIFNLRHNAESDKYLGNIFTYTNGYRGQKTSVSNIASGQSEDFIYRNILKDEYNNKWIKVNLLRYNDATYIEVILLSPIIKRTIIVHRFSLNAAELDNPFCDGFLDNVTCFSNDTSLYIKSANSPYTHIQIKVHTKNGLYTNETLDDYISISSDDPTITVTKKHVICAPVSKGTTANRPTGFVVNNDTPSGTITEDRIGFTYFDTDLNKPIFVKEVNGATVTWVDATGTPV